MSNPSTSHQNQSDEYREPTFYEVVQQYQAMTDEEKAVVVEILMTRMQAMCTAWGVMDVEHVVDPEVSLQFKIKMRPMARGSH